MIRLCRREPSSNDGAQVRRRWWWLPLLALASCVDDSAGADPSADAGADGQLEDGAPAGDALGADAGDGVGRVLALPALGPPRTLAFCQGKTKARYAPRDSLGLDVFPDDWLTEDDSAGRTGVQVRVDDSTPWLAWLPGAAFGDVFRQLSTLDGFGTNAAIFLRFSGAVAPPPSGLPASIEGDTLQLWRVGGEGAPVRLPFEATRTDDGSTLLLQPLQPLRPKTLHAVIVGAALGDGAGGCLEPSAWTRSLLERKPKDAREDRLARRWDYAVAQAGVAPASVAALAVFTTQAIVDDSVAIAADIRARKHSWQSAACEDVPGKAWRLCKASFDGAEYRKDGHLVSTAGGVSVQGQLRHGVRVWLPKTGSGPWPVVIFGHGLSGETSQGDKLADFAAPIGVAAVAVDAVGHGKHPSGGGKGLAAVFGFFGIQVATLSFDFLQLRDNWRQSTYDKLGLIEALRQQPDLDGDGVAEFDTSAIGYVGVSLGGIMGPELLALSDAVRVAVLSVPGGRVTSIIGASKEFAPIIKAFKPDDATDGDVDRFFCILQAQVDPGDAASYAPHVLRNRLPGAGSAPPQVLVQMAIDDEIVPNVATRALIRAFEVPQVGPTLQPIGGLVAEGLALPLAGNLKTDAGVAFTAGAFQFDRVRDAKDKKVEKADHSSTPASFEAMTQDIEFLQSWRQKGIATLVNPYIVTATPALP